MGLFTKGQEKTASSTYTTITVVNLRGLDKSDISCGTLEAVKTARNHAKKLDTPMDVSLAVQGLELKLTTVIQRLKTL